MKRIFTLIVFSILILGCQRAEKNEQLHPSHKSKYDFAKLTKPKIYNFKKVAKEESTHSHDWVSAWDTCKGYTALKKDGSLWQFGKIGGCNLGEIYITEPNHIDREVYRYYLDSKKIADGFKDAKIVNGGERLYAIKKDGSLWGWGEYIQPKPIQIGKSNDWLDVNINIVVHDGLDYDLGLKKDGSLWKIDHIDKYKAEPLTKEHIWDKVLVDCCTVFGQKKDGSLWIHDGESNFKKIVPKDELFGSINNYSKLVKVMKSLSSNSVNSVDSYTIDIQVREDGSLWFFPKVEIESVEK